MDIRDLTYAYFLKKKASKTLPENWRNYSVLEIGSGLDNYRNCCSQKKFVALDLDRNNAVAGIKFIQANINALPFKKNSFDRFIAASILEHVKTPETVLRELNRISIDGGYVAVPTLDRFPFIYDPINWIRKKIGKPVVNFGIGGFGHVSMHFREEWECFFFKAGFVVEKSSPTEKVGFFSAVEFFFVSIFFSRREYVNLMTKSATASLYKKGFMQRIVVLFHPILWVFYSFLHQLDFKLNGWHGYEFYLKKSTAGQE